MTGCFAKSKAGHDKDKIYIIYYEDDAYVYLIDGRLRTIANPKKKKKKHIQSIKKYFDENIIEKLHTARETLRDEEVKRAIKLYETRSEQTGKDLSRNQGGT